jgi:hypothetical protein
MKEGGLTYADVGILELAVFVLEEYDECDEHE